jgi:hypothetical protein
MDARVLEIGRPFQVRSGVRERHQSDVRRQPGHPRHGQELDAAAPWKDGQVCIEY